MSGTAAFRRGRGITVAGTPGSRSGSEIRPGVGR